VAKTEKKTYADRLLQRACKEMKNTVGRTNLISLDRFVDELVSLQRKSALINLFAQNLNIVATR